MSSFEYIDMFDKCQDTAPYHLFIFDMKDSKIYAKKDYISNLILLIYRIYEKIEEIEKKQNKEILHQSDNIIRTTLEKNNDTFMLKPKEEKRVLLRGDTTEPFQINGDTIGLTIKRDSLTENDILKLFDDTKKELGIDYEFHSANGYYETDDWREGSNKLFRGYAIQILSTKHKDKIKAKKKTFNNTNN